MNFANSTSIPAEENPAQKTEETIAPIEVSLQGAKIPEELDLKGMTFRSLNLKGVWDLNGLNLCGTKVEQGGLSLEKIITKNVDLRKAVIKGSLCLNGAFVSEKLDLSGVEIDGNLEMKKVTVANFSLSGAKITGTIDLSETIFQIGDVDLRGVRAKGPIMIEKIEVKNSKVLF